MAKKPTIFDVASHAGVSHMTVSRYLNNPSALSKKTFEKVNTAVKALGYSANMAAVGLARNQSRVVCLCVPSMLVPIFHSVYVGLYEVLRKQGYTLVAHETGHILANEAQLLTQLLAWNPAAIALVGTKHSKKLADYIATASIPICELMETQGSRVSITVGYSNRAIGRQVIQHFVAQGRKRIAFVKGRGRWVDRLLAQFNGAQDVARSHGDCNLQYIEVDCPYPLSMEAGALAIDALFKLPKAERPNALYFSSDIPAGGARIACHRLGLRVPDDLALVGFGNYELSQSSMLGISSIDIDGSRLGEVAATHLLTFINGDKSPVKLDLGFQLHVRASSDCSDPAVPSCVG